MDYACTYYSSSQPKTTAEYLRTYAVNFGGITHTSLTNNQSISPIRLNLLIVVSIPATDHMYIYEPFMAARHESVPKQYYLL
jgi:hypothetical protein